MTDYHALTCDAFLSYETHVCIQQTALELVGRGIEVHIVADATSSRSMMDRMFALEVLVLLKSNFSTELSEKLGRLTLTALKVLPFKLQLGWASPEQTWH